MTVSRRALCVALLLLSATVAAATTAPPANATATTRPVTSQPTTTRPATSQPTTTRPATTTTRPATSAPTTTTPPTTSTTPTTSPAMATPTNATTSATPANTTSASTSAPPASSISSAASASGGTDRTTMIVVVACVVAVFAVVVVVAIFKARKSHETRHADATTPVEDPAHAYSSAPAALKVRARPMHVSLFKPRDSQRPSQSHTERTTLALSPRDSELVVVEQGKLDRAVSSLNDDDDVAMLESYAQSRRFQADFLSAVSFSDSTRSLDVDSLRRSTDDSSLSTGSSAYWRYPEDTSFHLEDEDDDYDDRNRSFTGAPPHRQRSVDL